MLRITALLPVSNTKTQPMAVPQQASIPTMVIAQHPKDIATFLAQQPQYASPPPSQPPYGNHQQYPPPPSTFNNQPYNGMPPPSSGPHGYGGQPSYANAGPPVPLGSHPQHGHGQPGGYPGNW
ncbi:alpha-tubulin [Hypoxylon texense]